MKSISITCAALFLAASLAHAHHASTETSSELRGEIEAKGSKVSATSRAKAEAKMDVSMKNVDSEAEKGEAKVAGRLATEFGTTAEALMLEKTELGTSWGHLMIAHTLAANSATEVTAAQLVTMQKDGMGWGQIAAGLGLTLGEVVSAVNAESRVARGLLAADGKVAVARGPGAKVQTGAGVKANAASQAGGARVGAGVGVDAGVKIKP
jgi:hypothetical protein